MLPTKHSSAHTSQQFPEYHCGHCLTTACQIVAHVRMCACKNPWMRLRVPPIFRACAHPRGTSAFCTCAPSLCALDLGPQLDLSRPCSHLPHPWRHGGARITASARSALVLAIDITSVEASRQGLNTGRGALAIPFFKAPCSMC